MISFSEIIEKENSKSKLKHTWSISLKYETRRLRDGLDLHMRLSQSEIKSMHSQQVAMSCYKCKILQIISNIYERTKGICISLQGKNNLSGNDNGFLFTLSGTSRNNLAIIEVSGTWEFRRDIVVIFVQKTS